MPKPAGHDELDVDAVLAGYDGWLTRQPEDALLAVLTPLLRRPLHPPDREDRVNALDLLVVDR